MIEKSLEMPAILDIDISALKDEIELEDYNKIILKLIKYKKKKYDNNLLNKINFIINTVLLGQNKNIRGFLLLCKLNVIKIEANEEFMYYLYNVRKKIINELNKNKNKEINIDYSHISSEENVIKNNNNKSIWYNSEKKENLFHNSHNLLAKKDISSIKSIDNNKLIISYSNGISIYDSEKMDLITKRNIDVKGPLLILKNKNYLIGSY